MTRSLWLPLEWIPLTLALTYHVGTVSVSLIGAFTGGLRMWGCLVSSGGGEQSALRYGHGCLAPLFLGVSEQFSRGEHDYYSNLERGPAWVGLV